MRFKSCGTTPLGIYPLVDRAYKLEILYQCGITTAQLRVKNMYGIELENEIVEAIKISKKYNARFFVNDFWELAIKHGAYGIHLGQEDILVTDIEAIHRANIRLGISTHTTSEIKIALDIKPSYIAIGPIYETNSKEIEYSPTGMDDLKRWSEGVDYPIVVIGGINLDTINPIIDTKLVNGIALIAGVLENGEVSKEKTKELIDVFNTM
jgi:thiamine-phosphate diphosphorylase